MTELTTPPPAAGGGVMTLRPYQQGALDALDSALLDGVRRSLVVLPTGCGKTVVFSSLIKRRWPSRTLILAHREELLTQAADKLVKVAPEVREHIGFVRGRHDDVHAQVVVASVQTLARTRRLHRMPREFKTVIVDEAHHAVAPSYQRIFDYIQAEQIAGFTATPQRGNGKPITDVWDKIVYARALMDMIARGYLSDLVGVRIHVEGLDLSSVGISRGDYKQDELAQALRKAHMPAVTAVALRQHAADRKTVVFTQNVELAAQTAAEIRRQGFACAHVWGDMETADRHQALADFAADRLQVLVNVDLLTEGYDEPSVTCVAIASPTRSQIAYSQKVGRGTRLFPGKRDCLVLDLVSASEDLSLQSLPKLFDLREPPERGERVTHAVRREAAAGQPGLEHVLADLAIDPNDPLAAEQANLFDRDELAWMPMQGRWAIGVGNDRVLVLNPTASGDWQVLNIGREGFRIEASGLDFGYAQGAAEETVRAHAKLTSADAPWRSEPVSEKQLSRLRWRRAELRALGVERDPVDRGEASDLMSLLDAMERLPRVRAALDKMVDAGRLDPAHASAA